ncbi:MULTISPECIES: RagB/SusD family nutrient uptake outer membrane protein [Spirosoma]|uniref:RagB/SusD family nutrient uptake outer membrane protein n=1 Tax=Spirosoma sordidisoli TaxID=2502893 RepID=A0A4Q2UIS4_9BACT|nr:MULTISPECIES: RagB/SusD family nutrient uptake outer membrane protein [Spirosoma]RYC69347.1 RagB/SusD family nutrient uptake outer membrane protein [Spirosoma sordidisoli]
MKKTILCAALLLGIGISCSDDELNKVNPNGVTFDTYFNNADELTAGVNSIYALVQSNSLVSREWFFTHDLRGDEMASGGGQLETPRNQLLIGVHDTGNSVSGSVWRGWYRTIHRANVVIEKGGSLTSVTPAVRDRLLGEARFLRAWAYYELATLYGGVPLYKEFAKSVDGALGRSSQKEVYDFVIADLKTAEAGLPTTYDARNLGRATKAAAQTLLARTYLQLGDYTNAKAELQKVVNSGLYKLVDEYTDLTNEEGEFNTESIFEVVYAPSGGAYNWGGDSDGSAVQEETVRTQEYSAIGWRNVIPSNKILNAYERVSAGDAKNDPRYTFSYWVEGDKFNNGTSVLTPDRVQGNASVVDGKTIKVSWRKYSVLYKIDNGYAQSGINMRIMRYADVLLMLAECENETGNQAAAISLMNQVRARKSVSMPPYPTKNYPCANQSQVFDAIVHERMVELAAEQVRNFDIIRWRKNKKQKSEPLSYFIANKHELLPIPQVELDNSPALDQKDQNPGY